MLRAQRPYFVGPNLRMERIVRPNYVPQVKEKRKWQLKTSIFVPRLRECDARDFFDTEKVRCPLALLPPSLLAVT